VSVVRSADPQRGTDEILDRRRRSHVGASLAHGLPRVGGGEAEISERRLGIGDDIVLVRG